MVERQEKRTEVEDLENRLIKQQEQTVKFQKLYDECLESKVSLSLSRLDLSQGDKTPAEFIAKLQPILEGVEKQQENLRAIQKNLQEQIKDIRDIQADPLEAAQEQITRLHQELEVAQAEKHQEGSLVGKEQKLAALRKKAEATGSQEDRTALIYALIEEPERKAKALQWFHEGIEAQGRNDLGGAIEFYSKSLSLNQKNAYAFNNRGVARGRCGQFQEAIDDFNRAIQLDPEFSAAYNNRGQVLVKLGQYHNAIGDYDRAIELNPEYVMAFGNRAEYLLIVGEPGRALLDAEKVLTLMESGATSMIQSDNWLIAQLLKLIALKMLSRETEQAAQELTEALTEPFPSTWSFKELENWLETDETLPDDHRAFILEWIGRFKAAVSNP